ncbi:MAG: CCA tRNA nucleotidyltransferase [Pseudomonadota bacterium]
MMADDRFAWLGDERLQAVFSALHADGEARLVGGCVRDSLLGLAPLDRDDIDVDIATTLNPDAMSAAFSRAGIKWVATGAAHGTLTAVVDGLVCECTSLRSDVETDGRHAEVAFTQDWDLDWRRRDFTINALYMDRDGAIWDPASGLTDLEARRVRFIGDASARIREDALRILRFFRFSARFGETFDQHAMTAITEATSLINQLSKERIWSEFSRTLPAKGAPAALRAAESAGVLRQILDAPADLDAFAHVHQSANLSVALGIAALWPGCSENDLRDAFRPPSSFLTAYAKTEEAIEEIGRGASARALLFHFGRVVTLDALRLASARGAVCDPALPKEVRTNDIPVLPIAGRDLIAVGIPPGEEVGRIMRQFEKAWLDADAPQDDESVKDLLASVLGGQAPR